MLLLDDDDRTGSISKDVRDAMHGNPATLQTNLALKLANCSIVCLSS